MNQGTVRRFDCLEDDSRRSSSWRPSGGSKPASPARPSRELEVKREKLYDWLAQVERYGVEEAFPGAGRRPGGSARVEPGHEAQARLAELERKIGRQAMEIDFLSAALRRVEDLRRPRIVSGTGASLRKYGPQGGKAT